MNSSSVQFADQPYVISLLDAQGIAAPARILAETRFACALERSLGDAAEVVRSYRAWQVLRECEAQELDERTIHAAMRWPRAAAAARQAGLLELGSVPAAHFEVLLLQP